MWKLFVVHLKKMVHFKSHILSKYHNNCISVKVLSIEFETTILKNDIPSLFTFLSVI